MLLKVAAMGLTSKHLGRTIADMRPTLHALNSKFDLHVCGEGGEYETLTLDSPLFHSTIVIESVESKVHSDDAIAPVVYLHIGAARLQAKSAPPPSDPIERTLMCRALLGQCNAEYRRDQFYLTWPNATAGASVAAGDRQEALPPENTTSARKEKCIEVSVLSSTRDYWFAASCQSKSPMVCPF